MGLDASIYNNVGRFKTFDDIEDGKQRRQMNALQLMAGQSQYDESQRGIERGNALRDATIRAGGDTKRLREYVAATGDYNALQDIDKRILETEEKRSTIGKNTAQTTLYGAQAKELDHKGQTERRMRHLAELDGVADVAGAQAWLNEAVKSGELPFDKASQVANRLAADPTALERWKQGARKGGLTLIQQMEQANKQQEFGLRANNELIGPDGALNQGYFDARRNVAKAGASSVSVNSGQSGFNNESKLRQDFKGEPIVKDYADMKSAHAQIKAGIAQGTPIADTAVATKIMKLLDPGSVVRESELAIAMASAGRMDRMQNYVQMQLSGEKLTPQQRQDFGALADELMRAAEQAYTAKRAEYEQFGKTYGLNPDVLGPAPGAKPGAKRAGGFKYLGPVK